MRQSISIHLYFIISFSVLVLDHFALLGFVKTPLEKVVVSVKQPVYLVKNAAVEGVTAVSLYPKLSGLQRSVQKLTQENQELRLGKEILEEENKALRHQLEAPLPASFKYIPARVVSVSSFMEIDAGEKDGVKEGMVVVNGETLVGKVVDTSYGRSRVMLVFDPESVVPGKTLRGARGKVQGHLGESFQLTEVLQKDPLFIDDTVVTSGEGGFSPNLLIGKVEHITTSDVSPYKQAKLTPLVDLGSLEVVFIVSGS